MAGIGGSGMRGLGFILKSKGKNITGADRDYDRARAEEYLAQSDGLIYSDAVATDHPLRQRAREQNIPEMAYHEALGELAVGYTTVAVAGTHGKSSTTAMLGHIMIEAGLDPTVLVGARVPAWGKENARVGNSEYLIVEADEYRDHFLSLKPAYAIVTTIDFDHPDYFDSLDDVKKSFDKFVNRVSGAVVTSNDVPGEFGVGEHMQHNAALAVAMAEKFGVERGRAEKALASWQGLGRRMEELGDYKGLKVVSDYGHHPKEIATTLAAARKKYKDKKILVLFEAHTLVRLKVFEKDFIEALLKADGVLLAPVFIPTGRPTSSAGKEQETQQAVKKLGEFEQKLSVKGRLARRILNYSELAAELAQMEGQYDVALAFTAGELDGRLRELVEHF